MSYYSAVLYRSLCEVLLPLSPAERRKWRNSSSLPTHTQITDVAQQTEGWGRTRQWCCVTHFQDEEEVAENRKICLVHLQYNFTTQKLFCQCQGTWQTKDIFKTTVPFPQAISAGYRTTDSIRTLNSVSCGSQFCTSFCSRSNRDIGLVALYTQ